MFALRRKLLNRNIAILKNVRFNTNNTAIKTKCQDCCHTLETNTRLKHINQAIHDSTEHIVKEMKTTNEILEHMCVAIPLVQLISAAFIIVKS